MTIYEKGKAKKTFLTFGCNKCHFVFSIDKEDALDGKTILEFNYEKDPEKTYIYCTRICPKCGEETIDNDPMIRKRVENEIGRNDIVRMR